MRVYKITNTINGKVYIGKDSSPDHHRWYYHRWAHDKPHVADYNKVLYRAMRKYGVENFQYAVLQTATTMEEMARLETEQIVEHRSTDGKIGYNQRGDPRVSMPTRNKYRVRKPDGEELAVEHLPIFCRENGLSPKTMYTLASGSANAYQWKGWQCVREGGVFPDLGSRKSNARDRKGLKHEKKREINSKTCVWTLVNPQGEQVLVEDLKNFCQDEGLHYRSMLRVSSGERPHHKQWRILNRRSIHEK